MNTYQKTLKQIITLTIIPALILINAIQSNIKGAQFSKKCDKQIQFDGNRAFHFIEEQLSYGPRTPGSPGHSLTKELIINTLIKFGWTTKMQVGRLSNQDITNIIGKNGDGSPWIIIGAHYDTRIYADKDPDPSKQKDPLPGANDGASGVAVLLELARVIPPNHMGEIWLVFFDQEDNGNIDNLDWIMGSRYFVSQLNDKPDTMVLLDMVADKNLNIYFEKYSDHSLTEEIWSVANNLGYSDYFIPKYKYRLIDDHLPFLQAGIPAVDIIDFDYPFWHTTSDTIDKTSAESLKIVGRVVWTWLSRYALK
jgi:Zn-dependent M28 family amino/carboxypeptidase